jgi:hypothetical protein
VAGPRLIKTEQEHESLEGDWYESPADIPPAAEVAVERAGLLERASAVGLKVNGTWGEKRLTAEVEKAEAAKAAEGAGQ